MSIAATDLIFYGSASQPLDDESTTGGAIDTACRFMSSALLSTSQLIEVISNNAADTTQIVNVRGLGEGGHETEDELVLNGTTVVKGTKRFARILDIQLSAACVGTVSVRQQSDSSVLQTIAAGITRYTTLFKFVKTSEAITKTRYEKIFVKCAHASLSLLDVVLKLYTDPASRTSIGLAASVNDSGSVANRFAAPSGITFTEEGSYIDMPGTDLAAGSAIGIWVKQVLYRVTDNRTRPSDDDAVIRVLVVGGTA